MVVWLNKVCDNFLFFSFLFFSHVILTVNAVYYTLYSFSI